MDRNKEKYMNESLDLKSFYLRFIKKLWIVPVAALVGALIGAGIYYLANFTFGPEKEYEQKSQFYLSYSEEAYMTRGDGGTLIDSYNSYTWENHIMNSDEILLETMKTLQAEGVDVTKEEVSASIKAEAPSDYRILVVTVRNTDSDLVGKITDATIKSLEKFIGLIVDGKLEYVFDSIRLSSKGDIVPVKIDNRIANAAIFGAALAALLAVIVLLLLDALDDSVYVPEECEKRYNIPVLGVLSSKGEIDDVLKNELAAAYDKYASGAQNAFFISTDSLEDYERSGRDLDVLKNVLGNGRSDNVSKITPMEIPGKVLENYRKIGGSDGVILGVPMGKKNGTMTEHVISQLRKHDCKILGIVIVRANEKFIKRYYGLK